MWDGWTDAEAASLLREFHIDREGILRFHGKVARAHFRWWSLVPLAGCITAPGRHRRMKQNFSILKRTAQCSHLGLTPSAMIVVSAPAQAGTLAQVRVNSVVNKWHVSDEYRLCDTALRQGHEGGPALEHRLGCSSVRLVLQEWPRHVIPVSDIHHVSIQRPTGSTCCVSASLYRVHLFLTAEQRSDPVVLEGLHDPYAFQAALLALQAGASRSSYLLIWCPESVACALSTKCQRFA